MDNINFILNKLLLNIIGDIISYDSRKPYIERIMEIVGRTWETPYISVMDSGSWIEKTYMPDKAGSVDGIGTKGNEHWMYKTFREATLDALAMNLNDIVLQRARATRLSCHLMLPEEDEEAIIEIMETMAEECERREIAITHGETSIHGNMDGLEIGIDVSGFVVYEGINAAQTGDVLIGIGSNGLHSNGLTHARNVLGELGKDITKPTLIYYDGILELLDEYDIHGMMHITGGAFSKLRGILNGNSAFLHDGHGLKPHDIFYAIHQTGVPDWKMYTDFNCGIGFVLTTDSDSAENIIRRLGAHDLKSDVIGEVKEGDGISISSMFSDNQISL